MTGAAAEQAGPRPRGRPRRDDGYPALTRDLIVEKALELAGVEGFPALTMHRLSAELGVTPRALYNHVRDRQELVDLTAQALIRQIPRSRFDVTDWQESLRAAYRQARSAYRRFPRALLVSLDETLTPGRVDPQRVLMSEDMLEFFTGIGLSLSQALATRGGFLIDIFGFALLIDYRYDSADAEYRRQVFQPVPQVWLDAHPDLAAPLSRAAATRSQSPDEMFEELIDLRVAGIERLLSANG